MRRERTQHHAPHEYDPHEDWTKWQTYGRIFGDDPKDARDKARLLDSETRRLNAQEREWSEADRAPMGN